MKHDFTAYQYGISKKNRKNRIKHISLVVIIVAASLYLAYILFSCLSYYVFTPYTKTLISQNSSTETSNWASVVDIKVNTYNRLFSQHKELVVNYVEDGVQHYFKSSNYTLTIKVNEDTSRIRSITTTTRSIYEFSPKEVNDWWFKILPLKESYTQTYVHKNYAYEYEGKPIVLN